MKNSFKLWKNVKSNNFYIAPAGTIIPVPGWSFEDKINWNKENKILAVCLDEEAALAAKRLMEL